MAPSPVSGHLLRRGGPYSPCFVLVLVDVPEQKPQVVRIGIGPGESFVVGTFGDGGDRAADTQGIGNAFVHELRMRAPVGRDRGKAAGHGLDQRHVPALAAAGRYEALGRAVEGAEVGITKVSIKDQLDLSGRVSQLKSSDLVSDAQHSVAVEDLADEPDGLAFVKSLIEDLQEHPGLLALTPLEGR